MTRPLRSAGVRFGLAFAGVFALSVLALAFFLWWSTAGLLDRQTNSAIRADTVDLAEHYLDGGLPSLKDTIDQRQNNNVDDDAIYSLMGPDGVLLTGNLGHWPPQVGPDTDWAQISIMRDGIRGQALVRQSVLPPGDLRLLVGRDVQLRVRIDRLLTDALLWALAVVALLGLLGAFAVRGLFRMTLADVSATAAAISAGDLSRRVRLTGRGDEFDRLAETINDMLDRIGRLMDGVRQVSNAIAHDLRTPIARARARLEDAGRPGASEADLRAAIERAQDDLDGVTRVFHALLRIAEIEAGARRSSFAPVALTPLLSDLGELYEAAAEEAGQTLVRAIAPGLRIHGDREMVQQAVANLLDNALKFSPRGSTIRLSAEPPTEGARPMVAIAVADQGPGIAPADREHAADRFFRAESARNTPGSGLGLALVQAVATLHGGSLRLEDAAPGLRAVLVLPALEGGETEGASTTASKITALSPPDQHADSPMAAD